MDNRYYLYFDATRLLYLAVVIDLYSRRIVGWHLDKQMTQSLVIRALLMAINLRNPPKGLLNHSDVAASMPAKPINIYSPNRKWRAQ